jgi:hypothetical protein
METWTVKLVEVSPTEVYVAWESNRKDKWSKKPIVRHVHYRAVQKGTR